jgi:N-acyl-D-amino-acid deacylase
VMGEAASERAANPDEIARMCQVLREALLAGAYGFSLSQFELHNGYQGKPLASRLASRDELLALARVMRELDRGMIELNVSRRNRLVSDESFEALVLLAEESRRPVTWLALLDFPGMPPGFNEHTLARFEPLVNRGFKISPQTMPRALRTHLTLREPFVFGAFRSWKAALNRNAEEQLALYRSPAFRQEFREEIKHGGAAFSGHWETVELADVEGPANREFVGKTIDQISAAQCKDPIDTFLDIAVEDGLAAGFRMSVANADPDAVEKLLTMPNVLIGLSDAGAHVNQLCDAGLPSYLIHQWTRKRPIFSLEEAIRRVTGEPAAFMGLKTKGRIAPGMDADLVLFDPETIRPLPVERLYDLPGGKPRLVERSEGIALTMVNGEPLFEQGQYQGVMPGRLVKS